MRLEREGRFPQKCSCSESTSSFAAGEGRLFQCLAGFGDSDPGQAALSQNFVLKQFRACGISLRSAIFKSQRSVAFPSSAALG